MQLEKDKLKSETQLEWFKAQTDRTYKQAQSENESKRAEIELDQLHDGNPYNDKVVQLQH